MTILRNCLEYLSELAATGDYRVVALVHRRELADYPGIEYIEMPDCIKGWGRRLWCEYVTMRGISKKLAPVYLWLSLHDTTPNVKAERRAVYCQTSFPFLKLKRQDLRFNYKIVLFGLFTRFAYRIGIKNNRFLIVQAQWLRDGFSRMFGLPRERFVVAPPERKEAPAGLLHDGKSEVYTFFMASIADCHKNFETLCEAARLLQDEVGTGKFKVVEEDLKEILKVDIDGWKKEIATVGASYDEYDKKASKTSKEVNEVARRVPQALRQVLADVTAALAK